MKLSTQRHLNFIADNHLMGNKRDAARKVRSLSRVEIAHLMVLHPPLQAFTLNALKGMYI